MWHILREELTTVFRIRAWVLLILLDALQQIYFCQSGCLTMFYILWTHFYAKKRKIRHPEYLLRASLSTHALILETVVSPSRRTCHIIWVRNLLFHLLVLSDFNTSIFNIFFTYFWKDPLEIFRKRDISIWLAHSSTRARTLLLSRTVILGIAWRWYWPTKNYWLKDYLNRNKET